MVTTRVCCGLAVLSATFLVPALPGPAFGQEALPPLTIGVVQSGELKKKKKTLPRYTFNVTSETPVSIDLESDDFDPILKIYKLIDRKEQVVSENDDYGDSFNSRTRLTAGHIEEW